MTPLNNTFNFLNTSLKRGACLAIAFLLISFGLCTPVQAQEKPEVKFADVNGVKLAYYLKDNRGAGFSTDTKENNTTIPQMADDAAGLVKALGMKKVNIFSWSMGARIGQQLVIRHPDLVNKVILCAPNPGGKYQIAISKKVGEELNNPSLSPMENFELLFPITPEGKAAAKVVYGRFMAAKAAGTIPDDFVISKETKERQVRARIALWNADNQNYLDLKKIKVPVLVADGRDDIIDNPKNSVVIANQIPFAWLAFYEGGHAFLFQSYKKLSETVNVFLQKD